MQVALIGATGFVGAAVLKELLQRGHQVVALVRDPAKLAAQPGLKVVQADVLDAQQVQQGVAGSDAVLSAYNAGWTNPNIYEDFLRGSRAIVQAMQADEVRHAREALAAGGDELPLPARLAMKVMAKVMTTTAYRI